MSNIRKNIEVQIKRKFTEILIGSASTISSSTMGLINTGAALLFQ